VDGPTLRRKTTPSAKLETSSAVDRRDPSQASPTEEVGEVGHLDHLRTRAVGECADRKRGRRGPGRTGTEALSHRELVGQVDRERSPALGGESPRDLLRDRKGDPEVARDLDATTFARPKRCANVDAEFQYDPGTGRATSPRVTRRDRRSEDAGHVSRGERFGLDSPRFTQEIPSQIARRTTAYKRGRLCQFPDIAVEGRFGQR